MRDRLNTKILYELAYYGIIKFMLFASIKHRHIWREKIYHVGKTPVFTKCVAKACGLNVNLFCFGFGAYFSKRENVSISISIRKTIII